MGVVTMTAKRNRPTVAIEPRGLDLATAAGVYAMSETTLAELIERHGFPCVQIGRRRIIPVAQADAWFAARADGIPVDVAS